MASAVVANSDRARFSKEIAALNMKPLWERVMRLKPGTAAAPAIWRWGDVRPLLARACELITAKEAERRVLMLENPALPGTTFATPTLYAGLQAILPGEIAPTHRHTPNALRFVMQGEGAYTAVDGQRIAMRPGDFVVTPGWTWHDHGNDGSAPVVWLDGLDTAFANLLGAHFREDYPEESQPVSKPAGGSPILSYPYERTREALEKLAKSGEPHPSHGWRLRYLNPVTGGDPFPTLTAFMQQLQHRRRGLLCRRGEGKRRPRRDASRVRAARRLRRSLVGTLPARGRHRLRALQLLRPGRAGGARLLAGRNLTTPPLRGTPPRRGGDIHILHST